jgi:hypothetical protein
MPAQPLTVDELVTKIRDTPKVALLAAIDTGAITWYPPSATEPHSITLWDRGPHHKRDTGEQRYRTVTGETRWLRSHALADLAPTSPESAHRRPSRSLRLTDKGRAVLARLTS